nr:hypothetical protein BgiMline_021578 [Biomphalaria glabrata]
MFALINIDLCTSVSVLANEAIKAKYFDCLDLHFSSLSDAVCTDVAKIIRICAQISFSHVRPSDIIVKTIDDDTKSFLSRFYLQCNVTIVAFLPERESQAGRSSTLSSWRWLLDLIASFLVLGTFSLVK